MPVPLISVVLYLDGTYFPDKIYFTMSSSSRTQYSVNILKQFNL